MMGEKSLLRYLCNLSSHAGSSSRALHRLARRGGVGRADQLRWKSGVESSSEPQSCPQLNLPRTERRHASRAEVAGVAYPRRQPERGVWRGHRPAQPAGVGAAELRVVQHLHRVGADLEVDAGGDRERAANAEIDVEAAVGAE